MADAETPDVGTPDGDDFGPPRDRHEVHAVAAITGQAFDVSDEDARAWLDRAGSEHTRVLRGDGAVLAALLRIPMGQWFGGRCVPMTGVAAVGVPPERRGVGAARRLMAATLRELRAEGTALSALYPATTVLYRRGGYEVAGGRWAVSVPASSLRGLSVPADVTLRPIGPDDEPAVDALAREEAAGMTGQLDRGAYIWRRIREPRTGVSRGYLVEAGGCAEGHVYLVHRGVERDGRHDYDVVVLDLSARTRRAALRLLALLSEHAGVGREIVFHLPPAHPLVMLFPERHERVSLLDPWMLRVVHVPAALEARGYPAGARGALMLEVEDEVLPGNAGRHVLTVADGRGSVSATPPGDGATLRLHVRGLAALYSGHMTPDALAVAGLAEGPPGARALAAAFFAGPAPAMTDMF